MHACVTTTLQGLRWLVGVGEKGLNGILADDMGLGKTVQVCVGVEWKPCMHGAHAHHTRMCPCAHVTQVGSAQLGTLLSHFLVTSCLPCWQHYQQAMVASTFHA